MKRDLVFVNDHYYHVYNRSVGREEIFSSRVSIDKILEIVNFYRYPQRVKLSKFRTLNEELQKEYLLAAQIQGSLVEIFTYSFMPNHYHFLLKQNIINGITKFISNIQNSLAKYLNLKYDRHGTLFQRPFKAKIVNTDEEFLHVSRYIHLNPATDYIIKPDELVHYPFTSFPHYVSEFEDENMFVNTGFILDKFRSKDDYKKFVLDQVSYQRELALIKDLIFN